MVASAFYAGHFTASGADPREAMAGLRRKKAYGAVVLDVLCLRGEEACGQAKAMANQIE